MSVLSVSLGEFMPLKKRSIDPRKSPDEEFELFSIPAFDAGRPDVISGKEIGSSKQVLERGDVLLSKIVPHIRRAWVVEPNSDRPTIGSSEWIIFRSDRFAPAYLRHALVSDRFHQAFMQTVAGVGGSLLRARPSYVADIEIPLPPIEEQLRIAAVLDAADALRAKRRQALAKLDSLAEAIFTGMFGDATSWPTGKLGDHVPTTSGGTPSRSRPDFFDGEIPWVKSGELSSGSVTTSAEAITAEALAGSSAKLMPIGTVLLAMYGATVGEVAVLEIEAATNQAVCCLSPTEFVTGPFLFGLLRTRKSDLIRKAAGGAQPNVSQTIIRGLDIPLPPVGIQREYAEHVSAIDELRAIARISAVEFDTLLSSLQQRAFRGES